MQMKKNCDHDKKVYLQYSGDQPYTLCYSTVQRSLEYELLEAKHFSVRRGRIVVVRNGRSTAELCAQRTHVALV